MMERGSISAVDLFCGAGGLTHGLSSAGVDVKLGVDLDPACAMGGAQWHSFKAAFLELPRQPVTH